MASLQKKDFNNALNEVAGEILRPQLHGEGYPARKFFQENGGNGLGAPEMGALEYATRNTPGAMSGNLGVARPDFQNQDYFKQNLPANPLAFKAGAATIPYDVPGSTGGLASGMQNPLAFDPSEMQGTTLPGPPKSRFAGFGGSLSKAAGQVGSQYQEKIRPGIMDLTGGDAAIANSYDEYGLIGGTAHSLGRIGRNMGIMLGGVGGSALQTLFGLDDAFTATDASNKLRNERLGVEGSAVATRGTTEGSSGATGAGAGGGIPLAVQLAAINGAANPYGTLNPDANSLADPGSLDRNEIAALANRGLPAKTPTVDFGEGNYTIPKELRGSPEARANAWAFALDRGLADPNQNYTRTQRDEILMKAKKEKVKEINAWNKKISGLKEKIRTNADARNLISDQVLNAAKLGPEAGTAAHARAQQIRQGLPQAVKKYGRDVITALNDPASLPQEKRDKIFGALNIGPSETPQATALRSSVDSLMKIDPAQPNIPDGSVKAQEGGQFANAVLNQADAMGIDMSYSAPFKAYVEALNGANGASLSGRGKDIDKLAQAAFTDFRSKLQAQTSGIDVTTAKLKLGQLKFGMDLQQARIQYYGKKQMGTQTKVPPATSMTEVMKFIENGGDMQKILNTVSTQKSSQSLKPEERLMYGNYLNAMTVLGTE